MVKKLIAPVLTAAIVAVLVCALFVGSPAVKSLGGSIESVPVTFLAGIRAGLTDTEIVSATGTVRAAGGLTVGSGSQITKYVTGTCDLIGSPTIATNTAQNMDCAATGIVATDVVILSSGATTTPAGWRVGGAHASSTAGYITFSVSNLTGASSIPPITATGTVPYVLLR